MTDVQALESELLERGESPELLLKLAKGYADLNDAATANLYLEYLIETFPDAVAQFPAEVRALELQLQAIDSRALSDAVIGLYQVYAGVDSNASQGTTLSQLDLQLANGETLVLAVNPGSRASSSAYLGAKVTATWPIGGALRMRGTIDHVSYQDALAESISLGSLEVASEQHSLAIYAFDRFSTRTGVAYRGRHENVFWGAQSDGEEEKVFAGIFGDVSLSSGASLFWSSQVFQSESDVRTDISNRRYGMQVRTGFDVEQANIEYSLEYARDQDVYDQIFFPGVRDSYLWHRLSVALPMAVSSDQRVDLVVAYNNKAHEVSLNSWRGVDLRLVLSAPLR
jgi:hypothetical protein